MEPFSSLVKALPTLLKLKNKTHIWIILAITLLTDISFSSLDVDSKSFKENKKLPNNNSEVNVGNGTAEKCIDIMARNGLDFSSFRHGVGHGIHSLTLEEIRHFFDPDATEENHIPVVNTNLTAEKKILPNAPLLGYDEKFKTMALKVMAYFMLNDKPDFYIQGVNTLEKLSHQYHMHEIYAVAAPKYKKLKNKPPSDPELCPCVNDVTRNGVLDEMGNWHEKQLKMFVRPIGDEDVTIKTALIEQLEEQYLKNSNIANAMELNRREPWKPNTFTGPEQWVPYQAMLTLARLSEQELKDFTMFMYCKLNKPGPDLVM